MPAPPIARVVLADDHDLVRACIKRLLQEMDEVQVVAEARDGAELLEQVERLRPDLVVTDVSMRVMDGLQALQAMAARPPMPKVLVVSMYDSPEVIRRALRLGASGYLLKQGSPDELADAVRTVMQGVRYLSAAASRSLAESTEPPPEELLTARQLEVLKLMVLGCNSKVIGFQLGVSSKTVDVHRAHIMERLGLNDLASLALYAVRHRLVDLLPPDPGGKMVRARSGRRG